MRQAVLVDIHMVVPQHRPLLQNPGIRRGVYKPRVVSGPREWSGDVGWPKLHFVRLHGCRMTMIIYSLNNIREWS